MTNYNTDSKDFRAEFEKVHNRWVNSGFYTSRETWDSVDNRAYQIPLDDFMEAYRAGINILTPFIEKARDQHVMTMTLDSPRLDTIPIDTTNDAKDDIEKNRVWHAAEIRRQNEGGWLSKAISQSLVQYGIAIVREDWHIPEEPGEDYYKGKMGDDYYDPASDSADEERTESRTKTRQDYYKDQESCFSKVIVSPFEFCCDKPRDHGVAYQRSVIPYTEAKDLKSLSGKRLRISELGKLILLGEEEPDPQDVSTTTLTSDQRKVEVLIRDMKDPETGEWTCTEYVCVEGQESEAELFNSYPNPLGRSRYFVIASAGGDKLSSDPHLYFRPMMFPLYVLGAELNFYKTLYAVIGRMKMDGRLIYVNTSRASDAQLAAMEQPGVMVDGSGASQPVVWKKTDASGSSVVAIPGALEAWPWQTVEEIRFLIETTERDFWNEMPKRNLAAQYGDAKEPDTATQQLDDRQALAIPYSNELQGETVMWEQACKAERHAVIYFDKDAEAGAQKLYSVRTTSMEPLLKNPVDAGKEVTVTAETLGREYDIVVSINNETQAERIQKDLAADDAYFMKHAIDTEQWLEKRGFENPLEQIKKLERDKARQETREEMRPIRMAMRKSYASIVMGVDLNSPQPPMRSDMTQGQGQASPMQARPAIQAAPWEQANAQSSPSGAPM